jgi:hypothetical protein
MLELIQPTAGNVVAVHASGMVTSEDYEGLLIPEIEGVLESHEKARVLFQMDPETGFTAGAIWDDASFGLSHFFSFEKFALVSDTDWISNSVKAFGFMMPCPVKIFPRDELDAAKEWIAAA